MPAPKVYIVILNYKQWQDSRDCLESVLRSGYDNFSVLLVDNNSQNHSLENLIQWLENSKNAYAGISLKSRVSYTLFKKDELNDSIELTRLPQITFIQNDSNVGFGAGNNIALRFLQHQDAYVWLLNPDMEIGRAHV